MKRRKPKAEIQIVRCLVSNSMYHAGRCDCPQEEPKAETQESEPVVPAGNGSQHP